MTNLTESTIIVTGGSRGYGAGIAEALVKAGARVWITGRDAAKLTETARRIGATPFIADVADSEAWDRLMAEVLADLSTAGLRSAEIAWTSTVRFYANVTEARVGRASVVLRTTRTPLRACTSPVAFSSSSPRSMESCPCTAAGASSMAASSACGQRCVRRSAKRLNMRITG